MLVKITETLINDLKCFIPQYDINQEKYLLHFFITKSSDFFMVNNKDVLHKTNSKRMKPSDVCVDRISKCGKIAKPNSTSIHGQCFYMKRNIFKYNRPKHSNQHAYRMCHILLPCFIFGPSRNNEYFPVEICTN